MLLFKPKVSETDETKLAFFGSSHLSQSMCRGGHIKFIYIINLQMVYFTDMWLLKNY